MTTTTADIAEFVHATTYADLSTEVRTEIKKRILDSVGIALGSVGAEPTEIVHETVGELDATGGDCTLWGVEGTASPPEATMLNTALIRYLDYMDAILLPGETPHPSDNVGAAVVTGEYEDRTGAELVEAVGIAYEVHGALAEVAPGRDIGWDHIHVVFSSTACASKLLGLDDEQTRHALGIAAASYNPLRTIRTGEISMWKGIASANMARNGVYTAMLARNGMEGPVDAIEGQKGWQEIVQGGRAFDAEFTPCERVLDVMTKRYMAGTHAQTAIEGLLELVEREEIEPTAIESIHLDTYESACHVMGGGEGDRHAPTNREQADHSIPYTLAAAALDGQLQAEQYTPARIRSDDVRRLMQTVTIEEDPKLTRLFETEGKQPYDITVRTAAGEEYAVEKTAYAGHPDRPMTWDQQEEKFHAVAADSMDRDRRERVVAVVRTLEDHDVSDLTAALA